MVTMSSIQPPPAVSAPAPMTIVTSGAGVPAVSANPLHLAGQRDETSFSTANTIVVAGRPEPVATVVSSATVPPVPASALDSMQPGMRVGRPNEVKYTVVQKKCLLPVRMPSAALDARLPTRCACCHHVALPAPWLPLIMVRRLVPQR